jgi:hypothetical protein
MPQSRAARPRVTAEVRLTLAAASHVVQALEEWVPRSEFKPLTISCTACKRNTCTGEVVDSCDRLHAAADARDDVRRGGEQSVEIVGDDLCCEVLLQGQMGQPGHRLPVQAVSNVLQGLLETPAALIQRTGFDSGIACLIEQRDCQNAQRSTRRNITNRAHVRALRGAARSWSHQRTWAAVRVAMQRAA